MRKECRQTIAVYKKLGKKYVDNTYKILSTELPAFIKLLAPGSIVLDVGCAGGRDAKEFIKAGYRVIGIDIVNEFLREAKKRVPGAVFRKMDLMQLKFRRNYFDAIWANAVLLHFDKKDLPKILLNFYRTMKPGGFLHVRLKRGRGTHAVREKLVDNRERLFTFYYKHETERMLTDAGFRIVRLEIMPDELKRKDVEWISVWGRKPS